MKLRLNLWFRIAKRVGTGLATAAVTWIACAQGVSTTTVQGTVYLANGKPGSGSLQLSWPAFSTVDNRAIAAGRATVAIGQDGNVSVNLAPNLGSTPAGLYYTAVFHLSDGTTSTEYWIVPPGEMVSIAQVRAQVMPAAQAVQAASKAYVDQAIQSVSQGSLTSTGGSLTGPLYLTDDPTLPLQAADKRYVDAAFAKATPLTGGTMTGPLTLENRADTEIDYILKPGLAASQKGAFIYEDWNGTSQWRMAKDAGNNWALNSPPSGLDSLKAYQGSNGGDTLVNAASPSGVVRVNYEGGSGSAFNIYGGSSDKLYASFSGAASIQFPGLAPISGTNCLQIDATGSMTKTGSPCSTASGTVGSGSAGQIAYYPGAGTSLGGTSMVPISAGGTGASTAAGAVMALGAASLATSMAQSFAGPLNAPTVNSSINSQINVMAPPYNAKGDGANDDAGAINAACTAAKAFNPPAQVYFPKPSNFYLASTLTACTGVSLKGQPGIGNVLGGGGIIIQGEPGQDILHGGDPNTTTGSVNGGWDISDIQFRVDDSVDASSSFPHRWPGRWVDDGAMTSGSALLTSPHARFTCSDVGQGVQVKGAGPGGATLISTIASMPSCDGYQNTATLASSASTTVSNALAYVSVDNIPATQTIGNCALGFDNFDGNPAHHTASWFGILYSTMHNVSIVSTSGGNNNNSCGIYFQGNWAPYGSRFEQVNITRVKYGVVQGTQDTSPGMGNTGNDYQTWDHMLFQTDYPWISYNGGDIAIREWQLATVYGPVISAVTTGVEWEPVNWDVQAPEFEINNGGIGYIVKGQAHHFHNVHIGPGTAYLEAHGMTCVPCQAGGNIYLDSDGIRVELNSQIDQYIPGGLKTITDNGVNNLITGFAHGNPVWGRQPTKSSALNTTKIPGFAGSRTADFLTAGAGTTPFYNQQDLLFFPKDYAINGSPFAIVSDSTSFSGKYMAITSSTTTGFFATFASSGYDAIIGAQVPATSVNVYDTAKCPSVTSYTFSVVVGTTTVASQSFSCSTSYATNFLTVNLAPYPGQKVNLSWTVAGEVDDSWSAISPVNQNIVPALTQQFAGISALQALGGGSTILSAANWSWGGKAGSPDPTSPTGFSTYTTGSASLASAWGSSNRNGGALYPAVQSTATVLISEGAPVVSNTLNGAVTSGSSSITLNTPTTSSYATSGCFLIDQEVLCYSGALTAGATTINVTRGNYSTLAQAHSSGAPVVGVGTASIYFTCNGTNYGAGYLVFTPQWTAVPFPFAAQGCSGYSTTMGTAFTNGPTGQQFGFAGIVIQPSPQFKSATGANQVPYSIDIGNNQYPWAGAKPIAGSGAGFVTGPTSGVTSGHPVCYTGTSGQIQDCGVALPLIGTTGSIGGAALTAGQCASGTVTVTGATTSMGVTATPATYPGDAFDWKAYVSSTNTVTVKVCTNLAGGGTPTASTYNVRVIQ